MSATDHLPIELLSAHVDGETSATEQAEVETHLASCPACRATLDDLRRIAEGSARLEVASLPEGLRQRIASSLSRRATRRRTWLGAAASIAAVGLVATAWYLQGPEAPVPSSSPAAVQEPPTSPLPLPPPPPRPPAPKAELQAQAKPKKEARRDAGNAPARVQPSQEPAYDAFRRDEVAAAREAPPSEVAAEIARRPAAAVERAETKAAAPMPPAPTSVGFGVADDECGFVEFVEVSIDGTLERAALEGALRRDGAMPQPETRRGILDVIVPRLRWAECRKTLAEAGVHVDEEKVARLRGGCVGVTIRYRAP